jgi:hypothetical protein
MCDGGVLVLRLTVTTFYWVSEGDECVEMALKIHHDISTSHVVDPAKWKPPEDQAAERLWCEATKALREEGRLHETPRREEKRAGSGGWAPGQGATRVVGSESKKALGSDSQAMRRIPGEGSVAGKMVGPDGAAPRAPLAPPPGAWEKALSPAARRVVSAAGAALVIVALALWFALRAPRALERVMSGDRVDASDLKSLFETLARDDPRLVAALRVEPSDVTIHISPASGKMALAPGAELVGEATIENRSWRRLVLILPSPLSLYRTVRAVRDDKGEGQLLRSPSLLIAFDHVVVLPPGQSYHFVAPNGPRNLPGERDPHIVGFDVVLGLAPFNNFLLEKGYDPANLFLAEGLEPWESEQLKVRFEK